jgi:hypothetical protein
LPLLLHLFVVCLFINVLTFWNGFRTFLNSLKYSETPETFIMFQTFITFINVSNNLKWYTTFFNILGHL